MKIKLEDYIKKLENENKKDKRVCCMSPTQVGMNQRAN